MQVVVIATVEYQKEFQEKGIPVGVEVHFETAVTNAKSDVDAYFYLLPEDDLQNDLAGLANFQKPVFINSVVKTTIFLSDMGLFANVNEVYGSYFTGDYPARETVAVKTLPKSVNVEISVVATS